MNRAVNLHGGKRYAAIDQGTTSTRVVVVDETGQAGVVHAVRHQQFYPQSGWVEHDPLELLHHVRQCISKVCPVDAFALANQGESCLAWDSQTKEPLSPVIVWQDNRTHAKIAKLKAQGLENISVERSGLPLDSYFSASKLNWLVENVPAVRNAHQQGRLRLGTTDSFLIERLTGVFATDITTASRTALMNLKTGQWDPLLCELYKVPIECLPPIRRSVDDFGQLADGTPLVVSIVDQQASLYGHGCRVAGDTKVTFGTGAFVLMVTGNKPACTNNGLISTVAWHDSHNTTYALEGGIYNASSAMDWVKQLGLFNDYRELNSFEAQPAIGRKIVFVPALAGLGAPFWDRSAAGMWLGMDASTTRADLCQAALEGIALRSAQVIDAIAIGRANQGVLSIDGGLSRSRYFSQFLANVLQCAVMTRDFDELTAFGAAALSARAQNGRDLTLKAREYLYTPTCSATVAIEYKKRFADALNRVKNWR